MVWRGRITIKFFLEGGGLIEGFVTLKETMIILGNLTAIISDHLPQFAINPNMFGNTASNKSNIYEID